MNKETKKRFIAAFADAIGIIRAEAHGEEGITVRLLEPSAFADDKLLPQVLALAAMARLAYHADPRKQSFDQWLDKKLDENARTGMDGQRHDTNK